VRYAWLPQALDFGFRTLFLTRPWVAPAKRDPRTRRNKMGAVRQHAFTTTSNMAEDDLQKKLMHKAGKFIGKRSHTRGELRLRLIKFGDAVEVEKVLDRLEDEKLLNDADYAYNFALGRIVEGGWGPKRVRQELRSRQVAPEVVEASLKRVQLEVSERSSLEQYVDRYCRKSLTLPDRKALRKFIAHLQRRGFHDQIIREVLRRKLPDAASESWRDLGE